MADNYKLMYLVAFKYDQTIDFLVIDTKTFGDDLFELTAISDAGFQVSFEVPLIRWNKLSKSCWCWP